MRLMPAPARLWKPTLDCNDFELTTAFWAWLLDVGVIVDLEAIIVLGPAPGQPTLCLQRVDEVRSGKNRMHLDLLTDDLDGTVEEVLTRGGTRVPTTRSQTSSGPSWPTLLRARSA